MSGVHSTPQEQVGQTPSFLSKQVNYMHVERSENCGQSSLPITLFVYPFVTIFGLILFAIGHVRYVWPLREGPGSKYTKSRLGGR